MGSEKEEKKSKIKKKKENYKLNFIVSVKIDIASLMLNLLPIEENILF